MGPKTNPEVWAERTTVKRKESNVELIPNSFLENVRPILQVLRAFGRFPYDISENGIRPFSKASPIALYCVLSYVIFCYLAKEMFQILTHKLVNAKSYKDFLMLITAIIYLIHYALVPLADWPTSPLLVKYINLWHSYECQFNKEFSNLGHQFLIRFLCLYTWPVVMYVTYFTTNVWFGDSILYCLIYFPAVYCMYQYSLLWLLCQAYLVCQIRKLRDIVLSEGLNRKVHRIRKCWLMLSELTSSTGSSQGVVIASAAATSFLGLIIYCYCFATSLLDSENPVEWRLGAVFAMFLLIFYFAADSADRTTMEVGRKFISVVLDLKFSQMDEDSLDELILLLTTFDMHPPVIRLSGLWVVNREMFVSFVSNTLTYLIVLVQFKT